MSTTNASWCNSGPHWNGPHSNANSSGRDGSNSGLGLPIVREVAEQHGGGVGIRSAVVDGVAGTRMELWLPSTERATSPGDNGGSHGAPVKVLLRRLRVLAPDLPAVFVTGCAHDLAGAEDLRDVPVLTKPYDVDHLVDVLRTLVAKG